MTSSTPTPPCLGEREAVARTLEKLCDRLDRLNTITHPQMCADTMDEARLALFALRTENETLRAEREQSEKHRNDLMDSIVSLKTERGALKSRLAVVEAERDAAIARAEEAERGRDETRIAGILEWMKAYGKDTLADFTARTIAAEAAVSDLTAKHAQAEGEIATIKLELEASRNGSQ